MPLGAVVTGANANEGQQAGALLESLVVKPPGAVFAVENPGPAGLPSARGDGAFGNDPAIGRAQTAGFRMRAPRRGQTRIPGIGRIRSAVERGHALLCHSWRDGLIAFQFVTLAGYNWLPVSYSSAPVFSGSPKTRRGR